MARVIGDGGISGIGLRQVAEAAGVSVSTVDRVINERGSVSPKRRQLVLEAAHKLGLNRHLPSPWHHTIRIEIILPRNKPGNTTPFWGVLDEAAQHYARLLPRQTTVHRTLVQEGDFNALKAAILNPSTRRNALIIAADANEDIAPALEEVAARGEHVFTIVTDVPSLPAHFYAGVDNLAMGRTAGLLMTGLIHGGGEVLVLQATARRHEHRQRVQGFLDVTGDRFSAIVEITEEVEETTRAIATATLRERPIRGIYMTGHTPEAVVDLLRGSPERPKWITHELSPAHAALLHENILDFTLDQDPKAQMSRALNSALLACRPDSPEALITRLPEFRIYCRENSPK